MIKMSKRTPLAYEDRTKERVEAFRASLLNESDRGIMLEALLRSYFVFERTSQSLITEDTKKVEKVVDKLFEYGPLGSFAAKISLVYSLGLIPEWEYRHLELLRDIRNKFAHKIESSSFESLNVIDRIKSFTGSDDIERASVAEKVTQLGALIIARVLILSNAGLDVDMKKVLLGFAAKDPYNLKKNT